MNDLQHELEIMQRDKARLEQERERMMQDCEQRRAALDEMDGKDEEDQARETELRKALDEVTAEQEGRERITGELEESRSGKQNLLKELLNEMEGLHQSFSRDSDKVHRLELGRARTDGDLKALRDRIWNMYEVTYAGAEEFRRPEGINVTVADREAA